MWQGHGDPGEAGGESGAEYGNILYTYVTIFKD